VSGVVTFVNQPTRSLVEDLQWILKGRRVIVQGTVSEVESAGVLFIEADGIDMAVEATNAAAFAPGDTVAATGWLARHFGTISGKLPGGLRRERLLPCFHHQPASKR
jgi:hypothetical protein